MPADTVTPATRSWMMAAVKGKMDARGSSMTDTSPLIQIKQALARIKEERKHMDVRIGIATHTLVTKKLARDQYTKREAGKAKNTHMQSEVNYEDEENEDLMMN